jgi:chorismate mutase
MNLAALRKEIDQIDRDIIALLAKRFVVVDAIGEYKRIHKLPCLDAARWTEILSSVKVFAKKKKLSEPFIVHLWERIHKEALSLQNIKKSA